MTDPIDRAPFYHDGMRELQDRFDGRRVADGLEKHRLHFEFWEQDRKLIEEARFFFIATSYRDNVDCSMRSGDPGFVRITGPDTLEYPEYDGNNMYRTLGTATRISGCCSCASTASRLARASAARPRSTTARKRLADITAQNSSCASNARFFRTARATFRTSSALPQACRKMRSFPDPATSRRRRNGKAGTISRTCSRNTIPTANADRNDRGSR